MQEISHWWNREGWTKPAHISNLYHTQSWMSKVPLSPPDEQLIKKKSPAIAPISRNSQTYQEVPYLTPNQYLPMRKCLLTSKGPEVCQPATTSVPHEESSQAHPSDTNGNRDDRTLAAEYSTPSLFASSHSGRLIKKPGWMKDYVMTWKTLWIVRTFAAKLICLRSHSLFVL